MADLTGILFIDLNGNGIADDFLDLNGTPEIIENDEDVNENGTIDAGDSYVPLDGWRVYVDLDNSGTFTEGDTFDFTDEYGVYTITGTPNGTYKVRVEVPVDPNPWFVSVPDSPVDDFGPYRIVDFQSLANFLNGVNFENANSANPAPTLGDNDALTSNNQKWADLGFKFWRDDNRDFIPDNLNVAATSANSMSLEIRGQSDVTTAFVNDVLTGPYDIPNRAGSRVFDVENPSQNGLLGNYFLRGGGLYSNDTIPTLLIEYTTPTSSASGWIWDIDTTPLAGSTAEQWRVEWFDRQTDINNVVTYVSLGSQDSPIGQSAWVADADGLIDSDGYANWDINPNSLDGKYWEWSTGIRPQADIDFVRITFIGDKFAPNVGLAFDNFRAFPPSPNFGAYQNATISDRVWEDLDRDGIQNKDPLDNYSEPGVDGVTVNLLDSNGNPVLDSNNQAITTITTNGGLYEFNVRPGTYYVEFTRPTGFDGFSNADQGDNDTNDRDAEDSDVTSITGLIGRTDAFTVESGENNNTIDAGLIKTPVVPTGSIGNFVWVDTNGNGTQDEGDIGLNGVSVQLLDSSGNPISGRTTITDNDPNTGKAGYYLFDSLGAGTYSVQFTTPSGYVFTTANVGLDNTADSDANPLDGKTETVTIADGGTNTTLDAGLYQPVSIGNFVWEDSNGNGIQDGGENGIVGAVVTLTGTDGAGNPINQTFTTLDGGAYNFNNLPPGTYSVSVTAPGGYTATVPGQGTTATDSNPNGSTVTLPSGGSDDTIDFGFYRPASIGDYVWLDSNGDGKQTGENGIANVTVKLLGSDQTTVIISDVTSSTGFYQFTNLTPGLTYYVQFVQPGGVNGFTTVDVSGNSLDTIDSDAGVGGFSGPIVLTSGQYNDTIDAGFLAPPPPPTQYILGDKVWSDTNQDGLQQTGEAGIGEVTVRLLNSAGDTVLNTTTTDSNGLYQFTVENNTTYRVEFAPSASSYGFTVANAGTDDLDSDADVLTGRTSTVTIAGADNLTVDAGLYTRPGTLEGKTLGYWKNNGIRQGQWELTANPYSSPIAGQPYKTTDSYETIFGVTLPGPTKTSADTNRNGTVTLLEALNANGNTDSENLLRQSTAALLNSAHPRLDYYYSIGEVLNRTQAAFLTSGTTSDDNALATQFDFYNNKEGNIMA